MTRPPLPADRHAVGSARRLRDRRRAAVRRRPGRAVADFRLDLLGKYLCFAMVAVGIGLAWGRGGMLTLGQGVFFGLGGYSWRCTSSSPTPAPAGPPTSWLLIGVGRRARLVGAVPVPAWSRSWRSSCCPRWWPALLGLAVFRRRVRGAYFAILSQALAAAFAILLVGQQKATGGTNGLNDFRGFFGFNLYDPVNKQMLYFIAAGVLLAMVALVRQLMRQPLRRAARRLPRRRGPGALPRLRPGERQDRRLRDRGVHGGHRRRAVRARSSASSRPADVGIVPSIGFLIGVAIGGRAHPARAGARRDRGGLGGDDAVGDDSLGLDLLPGRCCSCWSSRSCRAAWPRSVGCCAPAARRRRPHRPTRCPSRQDAVRPRRRRSRGARRPSMSAAMTPGSS